MQPARTLRWSGKAREVLDGLDGKLFATVPEAAVLLRSDPRTVRRSIAAGNIPCTRVGPRSLVPITWLREAAGLETSGCAAAGTTLPA